VRATALAQRSLRRQRRGHRVSGAASPCLQAWGGSAVSFVCAPACLPPGRREGTPVQWWRRHATHDRVRRARRAACAVVGPAPPGFRHGERSTTCRALVRAPHAAIRRYLTVLHGQSRQVRPRQRAWRELVRHIGYRLNSSWSGLQTAVKAASSRTAPGGGRDGIAALSRVARTVDDDLEQGKIRHVAPPSSLHQWTSESPPGPQRVQAPPVAGRRAAEGCNESWRRFRCRVLYPSSVLHPIVRRGRPFGLRVSLQARIPSCLETIAAPPQFPRSEQGVQSVEGGLQVRPTDWCGDASGVMMVGSA
jgi:hypothetical protein